MKWIEWIHLRCQTGKERGLAEAAFAEVKVGLTEGELVRADMFVNTSYDNDAVVSLYWNSEFPEHGESALGASFTSLLQEFGMVHRTSWRKVDDDA